MITTAALHRLVDNIVDSASSLGIDAPDTSDNAHARQLLRFAEDHSLDSQDIATLFRVSSGEGHEPEPEHDRKSDR